MIGNKSFVEILKYEIPGVYHIFQIYVIDINDTLRNDIRDIETNYSP